VFGIQPAELIIILIVALIVLGPDRLPGAMRSAGRTYRQVRSLLDDAQQELASTIDFDPDPPSSPPRPAPSARDGEDEPRDGEAVPHGDGHPEDGPDPTTAPRRHADGEAMA
jgi:sec-independent protein translocase protein TatB